MYLPAIKLLDDYVLGSSSSEAMSISSMLSSPSVFLDVERFFSGYSCKSKDSKSTGLQIDILHSTIKLNKF